jgi:HAMP domain-containing protein
MSSVTAARRVTGTEADQVRSDLNERALERAVDRLYIRANEFATGRMYGKITVEIIVADGAISELRVSANEVNRLLDGEA